jgi:sporulation integral membrane protein YtvI
VLLPFLIAFAAAYAMRRPAAWLSLKTKISERVIRLILSLFSTLILFSLLGLFIWQASTSLFRILTKISEDGTLSSVLGSIFSSDTPIIESLPDELYDKLEGAIGTVLSGALSSVASFLSSLVTTVPKILLFITVTLISLIYFSLDLDKVSDSLVSVLPSRMRSRIMNLKDNILTLVGGYLKSYFLIMLITFSVMAVGLFLLKAENVILLSALIAVLDILPVIGVGTVLIPWSVFSFFKGNAYMGVGLIILFLVNQVVRQLSEPKILGKSLNLHPILTLIFVYAGYALFGVLGIIILPISGVFVCVYLKNNAAAKVGEGRCGEKNGDK